MFRNLPGGPVFEAVPDPAPVTPVYDGNPGAEPVAEPEPAWAPDQGTWEQMQEAQQYIIDQLGQIAQFTQPQDPNALQIPENSLLTEDDLAVFDQLIQRRMAPFMSTHEQFVQQNGIELARDVLADENSRNGDFLFEGSKEKALELAETLLPQFQARHGATAQAGEAAIHAAAASVRDWENEVGKRYYERQVNQLKGLSSASRELGVAATGATTHTSPPPGGDERDLVRHYFPNGT